MIEFILLSLILLSLPLSALAEGGIASMYHKDQGIAGHPAVVFTENFEKPLSAIFANWNGQSTNALFHSSDFTTGHILPPADDSRKILFPDKYLTD